MSKNNKTSALRKFSLAVFFGIAAASANIGMAADDAGPVSTEAPPPIKMTDPAKQVSRQLVRTMFVEDDGSDPDDGYVHIFSEHPFHAETVSGNFKAEEAYRYDVVFYKYNSRVSNILISFTSSRDLMTGLEKGSYSGRKAKVPENARRVSLSLLEASERDALLKKYKEILPEIRKDIWGNYQQSLPPGLLDPALYLGPGVDGYSFQVWNDTTNGLMHHHYFRDITDVYTGDGKKVVTEVILRDEGVYCKVDGEPSPDGEGQIKKFKRACRSIEKMPLQERAELLGRARQLGIFLEERELRTVVRDVNGKTVAEDSTLTMDEAPEENEDPRVTVAVAQLSADKKHTENICTGVFSRAALAAGIPALVEASPGVTDSSGNKEEATYTMNGKELSCGHPRRWNVGHVNERFAAHDKIYKLPFIQSRLIRD